MGNEIGWIVDAYVEGDYAVFWIKTLEGKAFKVKDRYSPRLYILPKSLEDGEKVCQILSEYPCIKNVLWTEKYTDIRDRVKSRLLQVTLDRLYGYRKLLEILKLLSYVKQMYNIDLLHIQKHIFENVKIAPTSKVRVEFDKE
ncbi:MAG: hypothetical protein H5T50_05750, partial [Nitrososphaeria archaeon]|nr:hypothetical protein [Nitrososphaeria archaeon]